MDGERLDLPQRARSPDSEDHCARAATRAQQERRRIIDFGVLGAYRQRMYKKLSIMQRSPVRRLSGYAAGFVLLSVCYVVVRRMPQLAALRIRSNASEESGNRGVSRYTCICQTCGRCRRPHCPLHPCHNCRKLLVSFRNEWGKSRMLYSMTDAPSSGTSVKMQAPKLLR
jgi:hypothetical protein